MEKMRVLVANEMCAYREVIAAVFQELRPHHEIRCVEPDDLDDEISRHHPHLVVCSRLTAAVESLMSWVMLYPNGENQAVIKTAGEQVAVANVGFNDLLSVMDKTELLHSGSWFETA
ncbi:MAG TPA: hypothetical protein VF788_06260 [Pseudonocardiaceae bacterium]